MTTTRADSLQEEFFTTNGKLYINFEQVEKKDDDDNVFWEMKTLEVADRRTAYNEIIAYYEKEQLRPLRELAVDSTNEFALKKVKFINEQIAKYRK